MAAMEYVIAGNIKVSNNSYGGLPYSQCFYDMIAASQSIGHIFVTSSGNLRTNIDNNPSFPDSYDLLNIISVAATNDDDCLYDSSNFGPVNVDLAAPGVCIKSTGQPLDQYPFCSTGTSHAAPFVTGVVALVMSQNPTMPWQEVIDRVLTTVQPLPSLRGLVASSGLLNASGALGDCNLNGVMDDLDISGGASTDCNNNGVPDECEINEDCQPNGVQDICDIAAGTSADCNSNDFPDECEIDSCGTTPMLTICASGDCCTSHPSIGCACNGCYQAVCLTSPSCCTSGWTQGCTTLSTIYPVCDCDPQVSTPRNDCNDNGVIDECDVAGGTSQDVIGIKSAGQIPDIPGPDGVPDECQIDCNNNKIPDQWDVHNERNSEDCNNNIIPDECEPNEDCNMNGVQDICDIAGVTSNDCNSNSIPDECETQAVDCNNNGILDLCDLHCGATGWSCDVTGCGQNLDCNVNCIPDECDISSGASEDCNSNSIPDECENIGPDGACCMSDATCSFISECSCNAQGGTYKGDGVDCFELTTMKGACCLSSGSCIEPVTECSCTAQGGTFLGGLNTCTNQPTGACCLPGDICQNNTTQCDCIGQNGIFVGDNTFCDPFACLQF